jgi:hypothetical protein
VLSGNPAALQLRYPQTLAEVDEGEGAIVLLPLPLDVIRSVLRGVAHDQGGNDELSLPSTDPALVRKRTVVRVRSN